MGCTDYHFTDMTDPNEGLRNAIGQNLQRFFAYNDGALIKKIHKDCESIGFLHMLKRHQGIDELPSEHPGIEYEVKLDVEPVGKKFTTYEGDSAFEPTTICDTMRTLLLPLERMATDRYLPEQYGITRRSQTEHHFALKEGSSVIMRNKNGGGLFLKQKSKPLPVPNGVGVMKRAEIIRPTPDSESALLQYASLVAQQGGSYAGSFEKTVASLPIVDTLTGRVYGIDLGYCATRGRHLMQLEVEYLGLVPGFVGYKRSEKQLIDGLVSLAKAIEERPPTTVGWEMRLKPTTLTKTQFAK